MTEEKRVTITQDEGDRLELGGNGSVSVHGDGEKPALHHRLDGRVAHATDPKRPLVHVHTWDQEEPCEMSVAGRVTLAGDEESPVSVRVAHAFADGHHQTHEVEPLDHSLDVNTALSEPIHHALQMRTPLQLRFCNPWHVGSDYTVEMRMGKRSLLSVRLRGATVATPQPCDEERCPPVTDSYPREG